MTRDLEQTRLAIETMRAVTPVLGQFVPAELIRDFDAIGREPPARLREAPRHRTPLRTTAARPRRTTAARPNSIDVPTGL